MDSILKQLEDGGRAAPRLVLKGGDSARALEVSGRYEVIGEIAQGGVGVVYRGRDVDLGRDVALKVLRDGFRDHGELIQRLVEEAQIGGQLQHPGIVPVYELGLRPDQRPYFAMKLVKGETLAAILKRGEASLDRLLGIFEQVCQTVGYAHARRVVHRDIKPANVMTGSFGEVQVLDWGFAKILASGGVADERNPSEPELTRIATVRAEGSESLPGSIMGTPAYMPPEQALGHVESLDTRSDVFSLGAVLYEILSGKPPYTGKGTDILMQAAQADLADALKRLEGPEEMVALCRHCLQPLRSDRPHDAVAVAKVVSSYLAEAEQRAHRSAVKAAKSRAAARTARMEADRQRRTRRLSFGLAAALLIAICAVLGGMQWLRAQRADRMDEATARLDAIVDEAGGHFDASDWDLAKGAVERAQALARAESLDPARTARLAERIDGEIERIRQAKALADKNAAFLKRLRDIRLSYVRHSDSSRLDAAYMAAFRQQGLALDIDSIRSSGLPLVDALENWMIARGHGPISRPDDALKLKAIADALDRNPWRAKVRDAVLRKDKETLQELSDAPADVGPGALRLLGDGLVKVDLFDLARPIFQRALMRAPDDMLLRDACARMAKTHEDRVSHVDAMVALAPNDVMVRKRAHDLLTGWANSIEDAYEHLRVAMRLAPERVEFINDELWILQRLKRIDAKVTEWRARVEQDPDDYRAWCGLGWEASRTGNRTEFVRCLLEADRAKPDSPDVQWVLGVALSYNGRWKEAAECVIAASNSPLYPRDLPNALAQVVGSITDFAGAKRYFERSGIDPDGADANLYFNNLGVHYMNFSFPDAEPALREAVRVIPSAVLAWRNLALVLSGLDRREEALAALKRVHDLAPSARGTMLDGFVFWRCGDHEKALDVFRRSNDLNTSGSGLQSLVYMPQLMIVMDRTEEMLADFTKRAQSTNHPRDWLALCQSRLWAGDFEGSIAAGEALKKLSPQLAGPYAVLANTYITFGKFEKALEEARDGLKTGVNRQMFHERIGRMLIELGEIDEALKHAAKAFEVAPYLSQSPAENVFGLALACRHDPEGVLREYRKFSDRVGRSDLRESTVRDAAALSYWRRGHHAWARGFLEENREEVFPMARFRLGIARRVGGDLSGAIEALERVYRTFGFRWQPSLGLALLEAGRFEEAARSFERSRYFLFRYQQIASKVGSKLPAYIARLERLARDCRAMAQGKPEDDWTAARLHLFGGEPEKALPFAARALGNDDPYHDSFLIAARAAVRARKPDLARKWLEQGLAQWKEKQLIWRDINDTKRLWMWQVHPDLEPLRNDPAWAEFWRRVELKVEQLYR